MCTCFCTSHDAHIDMVFIDSLGEMIASRFCGYLSRRSYLESLFTKVKSICGEYDGVSKIVFFEKPTTAREWARDDALAKFLDPYQYEIVEENNPTSRMNDLKRLVKDYLRQPA